MPDRRGPVQRIALFTIGTQGDIRPCLALGRGLQRQGVAVRLVTSRNFESWVRQHGLEFAPLTADFQALLKLERELAEDGLDMRRMATVFRQRFEQWSRHWAAEGLQGCAGADLVMGVGNSTLLAQAVAEVHGLPCVGVQLQPLTPSRSLPPMVLAGRGHRLPGMANLAAYQLLRLLVWYVMQPAINRHVRPQLGLHRFPWYGPYFDRARRHSRILYGFSPNVLRPPADWPESARVCGYWFLDEPGWQPDAQLQAFLAEGEPPVYVGFGSMVSGDAEAFTEAIVASLQRSGRRAVLATGWGAMAAPPGRRGPDLLVIRDAPHSALFPRMAVAVHHGGAGTAAAAARAGIPSVVVPFYGDQPFWARRLQAIGVAGEPLSREAVQRGALAPALDQICQPAFRQAAADLGRRIRAEDGIATAVQQLQAWNLLPGSYRWPKATAGALP
ncbi:glycosyltransferase [Frateuria aurantia]